MYICLTTSMHGLYMSTQHLDETLEPLNWIRACPSCRDEHSCERWHVLYYVSCNIRKYTTFKPHTRPLFRIFIPSNSSHLNFSLCSTQIARIILKHGTVPLVLREIVRPLRVLITLKKSCESESSCWGKHLSQQPQQSSLEATPTKRTIYAKISSTPNYNYNSCEKG